MKNSTKKDLSTLIDDIYQTVSSINKGEVEIPKDTLDDLVSGISESILEWAKPHTNTSFTLRMSNIGKPARQLYYQKEFAGDSTYDIDAPTLIKFLYGHILEEVLIFLVKLSGHKVSDQQKEVTVNGIKGHMDCKIDGEVIDIKTASSFAFKKFNNGTLREDDPFGYLSQLAGYEESEGTNDGGFLVINKESGQLSLYQPEELDKPNIKTLINNLNILLKNKSLPERCYDLVPAGTKGNMKLPIGCVYCNFKHKCYKDVNGGEGLRMFKYAKGIEFLTEVKYLPKVEEIF
jgi:hypothetical protein